MNWENDYLGIMDQVIDSKPRQNRTGIPTRSIPSAILSTRAYPAITTKKLAFKSMCVELEGFIKGITHVEWYQERGCHIWDEWAVNGELGPFYGFQWRSYNGLLDQLSSMIEQLKTDPSDRRMVCMAWNPLQNYLMALPPCHLGFMVHFDGELHLTWWQRSCDLFLGIPFNIASYALLHRLICNEVGLPQGNTIGQLTNVHLYENHIEHAMFQLNREIYEPPKLIADCGVFDYTHDSVSLEGYKHHPAIKAEVAV